MTFLFQTFLGRDTQYHERLNANQKILLCFPSTQLLRMLPCSLIQSSTLDWKIVNSQRKKRRDVAHCLLQTCKNFTDRKAYEFRVQTWCGSVPNILKSGMQDAPYKHLKTYASGSKNECFMRQRKESSVNTSLLLRARSVQTNLPLIFWSVSE